MFPSRNAAPWESDVSPLDFRLQGVEDDAAIGSLRFGHAQPQLPGKCASRSVSESPEAADPLYRPLVSAYSTILTWA